ncbi:MAG TPA: hypothetical protein VGG26_08805 [Terracidiphilus sp.]
MNRASLVCALLVAAATAVAAQTSQSNPYAGTSTPPPDDTIIDNAPPVPAAKPPAGQPAQVKPAQSFSTAPARGAADGVVRVVPDSATEPALNQRADSGDPDGDIVHPGPLPPGELGEGTRIRVRLLDRLSTAQSQSGDTFRTRVASDVFRGNDILIPAGAEIDGTIVQVSTGHTGGHGSMLLRPDTVILPDGSRYRLYAQLTAAPGSNTRVGSEGKVTPDSRMKKDGIEYGGAVGAGAVTGAIVAGPAGALAGTLIGAGAVTAHLLIDHPQATLPSGTALQFALTEPLNLAALAPQAPAATPGAQPAAAGQESQPGSSDVPTAPGAVSQN